MTIIVTKGITTESATASGEGIKTIIAGSQTLTPGSAAGKIFYALTDSEDAELKAFFAAADAVQVPTAPGA